MERCKCGAELETTTEYDGDEIVTIDDDGNYDEIPPTAHIIEHCKRCGYSHEIEEK